MKHTTVLEMPSVGYVRLLHAVPDAPKVDVYANQQLLASGLAYGQHTDYIPLTRGLYTFTLYAADDTEQPLLVNQLSVGIGDLYTVCICGMAATINFLAVSDFAQPPGIINALFRFVHLSPDTPAVDVTLPNGTLLFSQVSFQQITRYLPIAPRPFNFQLRLDSNPAVVIITLPSFSLHQGKIYTLYALGLSMGTPPLDGLFLEDNNLT
ncbi:DUF4397 domain-containing protein [Aminipila butyrica]|uniref:DUF4397 domain-containing protein n=1 Tax=Aminipila butyrica TaxID=433296 RepID=A0A858BZM4_9FIRM|nr:DUF4397 domain-containing protein [Aminipila butyrica]QIB70608.1 DUF4397 domain-containing protein [Aminipila butyrica]